MIACQIDLTLPSGLLRASKDFISQTSIPLSFSGIGFWILIHIGHYGYMLLDITFFKCQLYAYYGYQDRK